MHFSMLQDRLIAHLRSRVRGGELTERSAARLTGVSQPHLHNVLKGARLLSTDMADQVLRSLNLCVFDLLDPDEIRDCRERAGGRRREVPVLAGRLGPGMPFPTAERCRDTLPMDPRGRDLPGDAALVELACDPCMSTLFREGDTALIDRSPVACRTLRVGACYAIEFRGEGLVRRLVSCQGQLALVSTSHEAAGGADFISLENRNMLEAVKAKVVWIGRNLEPPSFASRPIDQTGTHH